MRISTLQAFNNGVAGLQRNYANATRTQEQISTGNRILTPADDPVASVRLLQLEQQQNVLSQYNANLTAAKNSLTQEEVTLNSVNTVLQRVRELATQAGNGALSADDRKSIAAELTEREDELLSLLNTRNARGEYLFSGFQGKTQPFVRDGNGSYTYQGDEGQRNVQIASSLNIPISDSGKSIFENVTNAGRLNSAFLPVDPADPSSLQVSAPLISDEIAFAAGFPGNGIELEFTEDGTYALYALPRIEVAPPEKEEPLRQGQMDSNAEKSDKLVFWGVEIQLDGTPIIGDRAQILVPNRNGVVISSMTTDLADKIVGVAGVGEAGKQVSFSFDDGDFGDWSGVSEYPATMPITKDGVSIQLTLNAQPEAGDSFTVSLTGEPNQKQGILDTIANLRMTLEDPSSSNTDIRDAVAVGLTNLDYGMISVDAARGNIGARLNVIETTQTDNEDVALVNKSVQAELRELDYAEALSRLSFQTVILEAAQQSYVKISGLNLFNAMR
ncbi:flagellar hook-associated protein 3 [Pseudomonas stutzeri]|uniref:flagellar hook-associated protein FlgL n=1 Tax=Stutzerimonas stutzeri TaxID=316 RepID=UPI001909645D|nr:flagellar hook-associated protein FlgL [Stutzerimonas stutzeri]MBK3866924.1 flagellar hook-associated protein 3 [Stutzerimonas stutzeri]